MLDGGQQFVVTVKYEVALHLSIIRYFLLAYNV